MTLPDLPNNPASSTAATEMPPESEPLTKAEINAWKVGFTPQAEIWNGRVAMLGLTVALVTVLLSNLSR
jgi:hypothetical protein